MLCAEAGGVPIVGFEYLAGIHGDVNGGRQFGMVEKIASFACIPAVSAVRVSSSLIGGNKVFNKGQVGGWYNKLARKLAVEVSGKLECTTERKVYLQ